MAKRVFCIGNGESRAPIDLIKLRPHGKIYGCNGLYRDFTPDVLGFSRSANIGHPGKLGILMLVRSVPVLHCIERNKDSP